MYVHYVDYLYPVQEKVTSAQHKTSVQCCNFLWTQLIASWTAVCTTLLSQQSGPTETRVLWKDFLSIKPNIQVNWNQQMPLQ